QPVGIEPRAGGADIVGAEEFSAPRRRFGPGEWRDVDAASSTTCSGNGRDTRPAGGWPRRGCYARIRGRRITRARPNQARPDAERAAKSAAAPPVAPRMRPYWRGDHWTGASRRPAA